jgi:hypothetical protein
LRSILLLEGEIGDGTMDDGKNSAAVNAGAIMHRLAGAKIHQRS